MTTDASTEQLIREIHTKVTRTDTLMETLITPGGRIPKLESDVQALRDSQNTAKGWIAAIGLAAGSISHFVFDWLKKH